MSKPAETCPNCGEAAIVRVRPWYGLIVGPIFIVTGFVLWIITLGLSFVLSIYGVFLLLSARECTACGWRQRDSKRG